MKKILVILIILISTELNAQFVREKALTFSIGYGLSGSTYKYNNKIDPSFYMQGEYVWIVSDNLDIRPYAGLILTKSNGKDTNGNLSVYKSTTNAFVMGGKTRFTLPTPYLPWLSTYMELGIGASIGNFETFTINNHIEKKGLLLNIPATLGFTFGTTRKINFAPTFYFHPNVKQFTSILSLGVNLPLD